VKTVYAIPGLATTEELFQLTHLSNARLKVLSWPEITSQDTLQSYAKKFLDQIDTSHPFYLLGVSFGGMLCSEISLLIKPEKTILISSCKCSKELAPMLKLFRQLPLYSLMNDKMLKRMTKNSRWILGFEKKFMPEFLSMVNSMKPGYIKNSIHCIVNWKQHNCHRPDIIHIHGEADRLLTFGSVKANFTIKGGNHAMIINRSHEINHLLNQIIV